MSLPDHMLEEPPDPEWCEEHRASKPCLACAVDEADRRVDSQREEQ